MPDPTIQSPQDSLSRLGWSVHFSEQRVPDDAGLIPARIAEVHRDRLRVLSPDGPLMLIPSEAAGNYAVGDWVLHDGASALKRMEPFSNITRKAAGHVAYTQRIAANVDTLAIVTSCNDDFSIARIERYLALTAQAGCAPLLILTKPDKTDEADRYLQEANAEAPDLPVLVLNAKNVEDVRQLHAYCDNGQTLALLGSSGVGKTTLRNNLTGESAATQGVREDDAKGRHTTTYRSLVPTPMGGWLIDTPGMRELQLADSQEAIEEVFDDLTALAATCKFRNCEHLSEPGCAVRAAIETGEMSAARLDRWRKLQAEDAHNTASVAQQRARNKSFGKMIKNAKKAKRPR